MADEVGLPVDVGAGDVGDTEIGSGADTEIGSGAETTETGSEPQFELDEQGNQRLDDQGNPIPKEIEPGKTDFKTNFEKIKAADPAAAEIFRKSHFSNEQYKKVFPTPQEAQQAKESLETYGGIEGIEELSGRAEQFASEMESFSKGDPAFIEKLSADDPEGFAKVGGPYLATLAKTNPEAYDAALAPIMVSTLEQTGIAASIVEVGNIIDEVYGVLKASGATEGLPQLAQAFKSLQKAYQAAEKLKEIAAKGAQRPLTDREKALQQKEQQLTQKEKDAFYTDVQKSVTQQSDALIDKALQTYYKQVKTITKDQKADVHDGVFNYIAQQLKSNQKYQQQLRTLLNKGESERAVAYVAQNVGKLLSQGAAKTIWNRRGFGVIPNKAGNVGTGTGTVNLTVKPKSSDVDWGKTPDPMWMSGEAILKGTGKRVKFDWSKQ